MLPLFETVRPNDRRPRTAIETGRQWVATGIFSMSTIRSASLTAHAAAKDVPDHPAAAAAAHAAGQAVATAHVAQHAYGGANYALRAIEAASADNLFEAVGEELDWQSRHLPAHLRESIMSRLTVQTRGKGLHIAIRKGPGY